MNAELQRQIEILEIFSEAQRCGNREKDIVTHLSRPTNDWIPNAGLKDLNGGLCDSHVCVLALLAQPRALYSATRAVGMAAKSSSEKLAKRSLAARGLIRTWYDRGVLWAQTTSDGLRRLAI